MNTVLGHQVLASDREHLWHPYTSMTEPTPTRLVTGANGVRLTLDGVGEVIDGMSSWWAAIHGYRHPVLDEAVRRQLGEMAHVMFGGLTHEPAVRLARQLIDLSPDGLEHVFLADSGSVSVEVAIKMALQYQRGVGRPERTRLLTVRGGYHGDTFGCMSVCDPVGGMHSMFTDVLAPQVFAERPPLASPGFETVAAQHPQPAAGPAVEEVALRPSRNHRTQPAVAAWAESFRKIAAEHAGEVAAIIVEPLLQGAGGMYPYPAECLVVMREVADRHGLLLIFDEIATGFARTGSMFAADAAGVAPDVMCVGKALTGGYMTLAAVLCTTRVAHGLSASESGVLMHGPTYMGNPLACAVASASLDLLTGSDWKGNIARIERRLSDGLAACRDLPGVADVRTIGAVGVVQLDRPVDMVKATDAALAAGVWLRPFRDLVYTMPPYVCSDEELDRICAAIRAAVVAQ
ncbi:adenosylmethionine--8-amino-7-oxononanoate transaminase [Nocardioides speluncae]|uniref:adenosylmethionine--8-amino-7-oxononanoate transaminase n=1 Tax=Nocardioides speluncae TaxID=2670337 RepID=UPI000D69ED24|nr:adenosylmethionine--8-amino-7-oxononanoate transaminase [Nocardioides speluncae]